MKIKLTFLGLFTAGFGNSQLLFDPTTVYETEGSGSMFDFATVHDVKLTFYDVAYHTILSDRWFANDPTPLPAKLDLGTTHFDSIAVNYKGNSTFYVADLLGNPKVPFNLDVNYYVAGQQLLNYKKLKFANALFDPTFTKEALASWIYQKYMPTHQVNVVKLTVNGVYLGAYVNTESIGKQFLDKHFGEKNGTLMKCEPIAQFGSGDPFIPADLLYEGIDTMNYYESYEVKSDSVNQSWAEFIDFLDVLNNSSPSVQNVLNVDRLLWYFAVTTVLPNEDCYNTMYMHNYYLYRTSDGKFQIIPWDLSESFVGALMGDLTPAEHYERDPAWGYSPLQLDRPLVYRILAQPAYFKRFMHHVRTVLAEFYDQTFIKNRALELQATALAAVTADPNKLFTLADYVDNLDNNMFWWTTEIAGITQTIDNRRPFLEAHPEVIKVPPTIVSVDQNIDNPSSTETVYISAEVTSSTSVLLRVTNNPADYASDFISVPMLDDGLGGDITSGDNIFTAAVPFTTSNDHIKYYIEAENSQAIALDPERAEYFYYHYYVDQVVEIPTEEIVALNIFPNPTSDFLNVNINAYGGTIEIYSISGKLMNKTLVQTGQNQIDCSGFESGVYVLCYHNGEHRTVSQFIVR